MRMIPVWIIAVCALAHTLEVYELEDGGLNVYFGNWGYHIARDD